MEPTPPTTSDQRAPKVSATQPTNGDPSGVPPRNTMRYSDITRPRSSAGTVSCTTVFAEVMVVIAASPSSGVTATKVPYVGIVAITSSTTPKATAAPTTRRSRGAARRAASSAPTIEPSAIVVPSTPYSPAPLP